MRRWFTAVFAASGAAALIYEVTWTRLLTLQLGHGVAAASTVLAAFMGGLAAGSGAGGRWGATFAPAQALKVYAALEIAIALLALVLPLELRALDPLLAHEYADGRGSVFPLLRLAASLLVLAVPAAAMGATFPIAARWFVQHVAVAARDAGVLYSANTIGAAAGALLAGFVLLPLLGLTGATWTGIALNAAAAAGAWVIAGRSPSTAPAEAVIVSPNRTKRRGTRAPDRTLAPAIVTGRPWLAAFGLGISGFTSLTLQVVWTRLLALILGPTTYAFSTMVSVFIAGLALGAAIGARLANRSRDPVAGLAMCVAAAAGCSVLAAALVDKGLLAVAEVVAQPDTTFGTVVARQAMLAVGLLAPMTIVFGIAFPFAVAVATRTDDTITTDLGLIYAINTTGAIAGALLTGFAVISWFGLHGTIRLVAIVSAIGALAVLVVSRRSVRGRSMAFAIALAVLAGGIWLPDWDRLLLSSGAYKYSASLRGPDLPTALRAGRLLYYREGPTGTVAVRSLTGSRSLAIDGKVDASNSGDMLTQRLLAHVPLLLHPHPKIVAILGLGSGVTLGSALTHPVVRADVLEISPEVVEASRYFDVENHGAIVDPRTRLIVGDGRTHLFFTRTQYDVIVSEPSNPWMAGIASLFTQEFFEAARRRLTPGGVFCQWAHTYDISADDLKSIVATFVSVFPGATMWLVGDGDVLLIGSTEPIEPRLAIVADAWRRPGVNEDLATVGALDPFHVLSLFVADGAGLAEWSRGAPIQTDNRAALEFSGPRTVFARSSEDNAVLLRELAARRPPPQVVAHAIRTAAPDAWRNRGLMLAQADAHRPAYDDLVRALEGNPRDRAALDGLLRTAAQINRTAEVRMLLTRLASDPTNDPAKLALSRLLASLGEYEEGVRLPMSILQTAPGDVAALEQLASILSDVGDDERLEPVVAKLRSQAPASEAAQYFSAALAFIRGRQDIALAEARRVVAANPGHAKAQNLVGACLANLGRREEARAAFEASLTADPREPGTYTNLANLEMEAGNRELATQYFAEALTIDPSSDSARRGLAQTTAR